MKNFDSEGNIITLAVSSIVAPNNPPKSGDPCVAGRLAGVACKDGVTGDNLPIAVKGVYKLSCSTVHNGLSVGETVYIDPASAVLSDDQADVPFGIALETVAMGATTTIKIRLFGGTPGATGAGS